MKLASFDIFDTTLIRKCGAPENLFFLLSKLLFPNNDAYQTEFFMWRMQAEKMSMQKLKKQYLTLEEIYCSFNEESFNCKKSWIIKREKDLESSQLVYNYEIKKIIAKKRAQGYVICFISDMYLSEDFLKEILIREECGERKDNVYVSCSHGKTKADGGLYKIVRDFYPDIEVWEHYGDNYDSDIYQSLRIGIKAHKIDTSYSKSEKYLLSNYEKFTFGSELSVLVGLQRCARLHMSENGAFYKNASDYVASMYIPYIKYIFDQASKNNFKRLYFLSRDSYILYELAQNLRSNYPNIECKYLFVSRRSLALAVLKSISVECIANIITGQDTLIGLKINWILDLLQLSDLSIEVHFNKIRNKIDEQVFIDKLLVNEKAIKERQEKLRALLDDYFVQEGVYDTELKMAMVDVGWLGTTRLMINNLRAERGLFNIPFFYLGCREDVIGNKFGNFYPFLPLKFVTSDNTVIIESYYSASKYPTTIGYAKQNMEIVPIFKDKYDFSEKLSDVNTSVCVEILKYFKEISYVDFKVALSVWGIAYILLFNQSPKIVDYDVFRKIKSPDKGNLIQLISPVGLLRYFIFGHTGKDCMQINSIYYTYKMKWLTTVSFKKLKQILKRFCIILLAIKNGFKQ